MVNPSATNINKLSSALSLSLSRNSIIDSLKKRRAEPSYSKASSGFTIVELLVVIVVIGILAAITLVSYTGVTGRATVATLTSDLDNASKQLKLYQVEHSAFPVSLNASNCPLDSTTPTPIVDTNYCLKASSGNTLTYSSNNSTTFALTNTNTNGTAYGINNASSPVALAPPTDCPTGFIPVPGSSTYGQAGFCVMKYEAKQVGSTTTPISTATSFPWVNISQTTAIANAPNTKNTDGSTCTTCHLITEAEWLTIAQNVLSVSSNWNGGVVGTSYIPRGNSNGSAAMDGTTDLTGINQRTLTLTNNETIWDMAGNVWEWTSGTSTTGQPGVTGAGYGWREWTAVTNPGTISPNPSPTTTGITGANSWTSSNGIGQIYSNADETGLRGFFRGGDWFIGGGAGVLALFLAYGPGDTGSGVGFRVSR